MTEQLIISKEQAYFDSLDPHAQKMYMALSYLRQADLYYGTEHENRDNPESYKASWMIAEHPFFVTKEEENYLNEELPSVIADFHSVSAELLRRAFAEDSLPHVKAAVLSGYPENIRDYYERIYTQVAIEGTDLLPVSTRPDVQITRDETGKRMFKIIEYNTDGRADKGNTEGVGRYSDIMFAGNEQMGNRVGVGLASAFVDALSTRYKHRQEPVTVVTILPLDYRTEYDSQNIYFANRADFESSQNGSKINWKVAKADELVIEETGVYLQDGTKVDVIDREFELQGFADRDMVEERELVEAYLRGAIEINGSILPHNDKVMMALLFDHELTPALFDILGGDQTRLDKLREAHAETYPIAAIDEGVYLNGGGLLKHEHLVDGKYPVVIKKYGNSQATTGAAGVYISADHPMFIKNWKGLYSQAVEEGDWIVQRFYPSETGEVFARRNEKEQYSSSRTRNPEAKFRFAPYYVRHPETGKLVLGEVLVTASMHPKQKKNRESHLIHGNRDSAYMQVRVK